MTTATLEHGDSKTRLKIIDADTHLSEPPDLWLKHAPAALRDRVPQIKQYNGRTSWVIDGDKPIGLGANPYSAVLKDGGKVMDVEDFGPLTYADVHPGSYAVKPRLAEMDRCGVWAQIVYPNILGFGGQGAAKVDPALRLACVQIYNDATAEMQAESGLRLFPMALLPWWDLAAAVKETERAKTLGLRGVNINSDPHTHKDEDGQPIPDLGSPRWDPLWEVCQALDMPINFHIGASEQSMDWVGGQGWPSLDTSLRGALSGSMLFFNNGRVMANIIYSRALDRYPQLKFVSVESGIGWVPFLLESLDHQLDGMAGNRRFEMRPSEYFKRNFYACFWFEKDDISQMIRKVGVDNVLFETDFPHPTCLFPIDDLDARLSGLTLPERDKVLSTNAARVYNIPIA
ncbi:amidohydrolase family protein [Phenylobacterium sp. LjRoot225]|uniref:amidohydrolase family protein n=1 Tax=Phenylobacterium sp. LjRoot225 TaxID=3342285 RepID=UPI003ECCA3DD